MTSNRLPRRSRIVAAIAILAMSTSALSGCIPVVAPVTSNRGYIVNETDLKKVKPKVSTIEEVNRYMGTPSTVSADEGVAWYYITSKFEAYLYHSPEEVERTVIAIYFDKTNVVQEVLYYGLQDGEIIDLQTRKTPTRGKELTVLGQLFGNLGRFNNQNSTSNSKPKPGGR